MLKYNKASALILAFSAFSFLTGAPAIKPRKKAPAQKASMMLKACPAVAFIKRDAYGMKGTNAVMFAHRTGTGSEICIYDPKTPEKPHKTIFKTEKGFIFDMNASWDGKKLVFSFKTEREQPFHIWEIKTDGSGLKQLTHGRWHDFSPVYYPDGRIVFSSSRVESFSLCQNFLACALYICNADGKNLRRIDFTSLSTLSPSILSNGSILCTRWEYQDKNIFGWEGLWTINPNGRQLRLYHGNTFRIPNAVYGGMEIPETRKAIVVWAAHHHVPIGDIAIVDRSKGLESLDSMWKLTDVTPVKKDLASSRRWRVTGTGGGYADTLFPRAFTDPFPFSKDYSIVSFGGDHPKYHHLYILDHNSGETCLLYETEGSCFSATPLNARARPHVIPGDCPQEKGEGTYFVQDVYQGLSEQGVERGMVKRLRIMAQVPKKYNTEGPRYHDHYPVIGQGTYYVKYNHGTVPVYADGSAYFNVPSNEEIYFIALDKDGKEIQRMGSVCQITTGESTACLGCHEDRLKSPTLINTNKMKSTPDSITPPSWGAGPVDFVRHVQPVLDKYCVKCHNGANPQKNIDLSGDKTRLYNMAYETLTFKRYVDYYYLHDAPNGNFPALSTGSWVSRLTKLIESGHQKVNMDAESRRRIYAWIDANVPYYGTWDMTRPHTLGGRDLFAKTIASSGMKKRGRSTQFQPWVARYHECLEKCGLKDGSGFLVNFTNPLYSRILTYNLAKSAGGFSPDKRAVFKTAKDPLYVELLAILKAAKKAAYALPRMDMEGAVPMPQERDFGRSF